MSARSTHIAIINNRRMKKIKKRLDARELPDDDKSERPFYTFSIQTCSATYTMMLSTITI